MLNSVSRFVATCMLVLLGACSTVVEGSDQTVTVITEPPGAQCELFRDGSVIAVANPTPSSLSIDKSKNDISITCTKDGHFDGSETMVSEFAGATLGNFLIGGGIGLAIDAASGAMNKYPESVTIVMPPETFDSADARDRFFDTQIARVTENADIAREEITSGCNQTNNNCETMKAEIDERLAAQVETFEQQRSSAIIQ